MKRRIEEETVLFISVIKWVFLATVIGVIVGFSTTLFLKALKWCTTLGGNSPNYFLMLPVALFVSVLLIKYLAPDAKGHGTEKVIEAIHKRAGRIKLMVVPVKLAATLVTLAAGGSVGKEGPCAQIGGGLASGFADFFKFGDNDRRKLVICGISAGFASVFGTPIAGAIFGVEVLFVGSLLYDVLLPSFIAGVVSFQVSSAFGITYFYHTINFVPVFSEIFFLKVILAGMFFGICSALLIEVLNLSEKIAGRIRVWEPLKGIIGGALLVGLTLIFSKDYLGLGLDTVEGALTGAKIIWYAFILKIIFTSITLSFGGSGGIVTPIFFIGSAAGVLFGTMLGLDTSTFAAIGLVSLLAGAANTPISASIMSVELFGPKIAPYATVACVVSFLMTGHRSVYPSQVLAIKKSSSLSVDMEQDMEDVVVNIEPREKSLTKFLLQAIRKVSKK
ncbi:MAG: chloride channel protein [Candidatus Omnitrophota bacterium]